MKDPRDEIQDALQHQDFLERIDAMRGYDAAEKRLLDRLEAAEKERDALRAKVAEMEQQEPVGVLHVGSYYGEELQDWEFEADQRVCDYLNERHVNNPTSLNLYALPGAKEQEPTRDWWDCLIADISAIDCMYRGSPTYAHDAYWMREYVVRMLEQRRDALPGAQGEEK